MVRELVNTGIHGYDELTHGGFYKKTVNVISGESGTGKTVFGAQFLYQGAMESEKGLCIMTTESADSFVEDMDSFGWDFDRLSEEEMITFIDVADPKLRLTKKVEEEPVELIRNFKNMLSQKIDDIHPKRIFIDSIEALLLAIDSPYKLKTLVDDLFGMLRTKNVASVVTVGTTFSVESLVEYGADSVTRLGRVVSGNQLQRSIYVAKKRGSDIINEIRSFNISDNGITVLAQSPYISTI